MVVTNIRRVEDRTKVMCPWCRYTVYPTHEGYLWVSHRYMGRHFAKYHKEEFQQALTTLYTKTLMPAVTRHHIQSQEQGQNHGFRRGL